MNPSPFYEPSHKSSKNTFLTGVHGANAGQDKASGKNSYREIHSQIHLVLENFDEHIDNILERNEKDFLAAYRGHMTKVQKELEYFKEKTSKQENDLRKDEHVQKIETSLEFFRQEALNLGQQMNEFKSEASKWKARCNNLQYDNAFLEKQIIANRHENKWLNIALKKSQSHWEELIAVIKQKTELADTVPKELLLVGVGGQITLEEKLLLKGSGDLSKYSFTPMSPSGEGIDSERKRPMSQYSDSRIKVYDKKPRAFIEYLSSLKVNKEQFCLELEQYIEKQEKRFQNVINNVKSLLEKEKNTNRKLRNDQAKNGTPSTKTEMLTYFSGSMPEPVPSQANIDRHKFPSAVKFGKLRGKSQGGSRKTRFRNTLDNKSKQILRTPMSMAK